MPSTINSNQMVHDRVLVDDLSYIDQEYGDPSLREVVSYEISLCNIDAFSMACYWRKVKLNF